MKDKFISEAELVASTMSIINDLCNAQLKHESKFVRVISPDCIDLMYEEAQQVDAIVIDGVIRTKEELLYKG